MNLFRKWIAAFLLVTLGGGMAFGISSNSDPAPDKKPDSQSWIQIIPKAELGFAAVLFHQYQAGSNGTLFNFTSQGGQDTLYPFLRLAVDVKLFERNYFTFLYQPLTLKSKTVVNRNGTTGGNPLLIDDAVFPVGTPVDITYGFDFWRFSYLFDFLKDPDTILGLGVSLQLRNASIDFSSTDGTRRSISQNIGPVPIIKFRFARWFSPLFGLDFEADGFYAAGAGFNGSAKPFEGWIWDAALSVKTRLAPKVAAFATIRSIGGGAKGNNAYTYVSSTTSVNSYTFNSLATMALNLGVSIE
ncbi:MAG: hypothetical protein JNM63_17830 [Spirochaetia bacterium]|nr:hypothetical protein [Spirochaetia bacterium]